MRPGPSRLTRRRLEQLIGLAHAELLMVRWGGYSLPRLTAQELERDARDEAIRADAAVLSYRALAAKYGLSLRQVKNITN